MDYMGHGWFDVHFDLRSKVFRLRAQDSCFRRNDNGGLSAVSGQLSAVSRIPIAVQNKKWAILNEIAHFSNNLISVLKLSSLPGQPYGH